MALEYTPGMLDLHMLPITSGVSLEFSVTMFTFELSHSKHLPFYTFLVGHYSLLSGAPFIMGLKLLWGKIVFARWATNLI